MRMGMMSISGHADHMQDDYRDRKDRYQNSENQPKASRCIIHDSNKYYSQLQSIFRKNTHREG